MPNRFTVIRPQEFQQTYEPFPLQQMMGLAQYKQGREDQINAALGKAAGDAAVEGGLFTQPIAQEITKQRLADIDRLTGMFQDKRDVGSTIRELSKLQQQWKTDPRLSSVQSDAALKNTILANMAKPEYGTSMRYSTHNPLTGGFNRNDIEQLVSSGHQFTPQDYGLLVNPGAEKAYGNLIDIIKPDILEGYTKNEDGSYSSKIGNLDMATVMRRSSGVLGKISSDGVNIDRPEALPPEAQQYIAYMKDAYANEGRQYTYEDAIKDFKDQAALRLQIRRSDKLTEDDGSSESSKKDTVEFLVGASLGPTTLLDASDATMVEIGEKGYKEAVKATGLNYFTGSDSDGNSALDYVSSDYVPDPNLSTAQNEANRVQYVKDRQTQDAEQYNSTFNTYLQQLKGENKPKTVTVGGRTITQQTKSPRVLEQEAHDKTMGVLYKRRLLGTAMMKTALEVGEENVPKFDKEGKIIGLTIEQQKAHDKWYERNSDRGTSMGAASTVVIGGIQAVPKGFIEINGQLVPEKYKEYYSKLDNNTKEVFSNTSFVAKQYSLYAKGGELSSSEIPVNQKMIIDAAQKLAKLPESNTYYNGRKINALQTIGSSTEGHSMDQLYLPQTADGKSETADFTKGKVEFNPMTIYYNPKLNKWLARGNYSRTGVQGESDLESATYEIDVTPTMSSIMTGDEKLQVTMKDAVHDALLSIPPGTSGIANVGMSNEQLDKFGNIHVIHNSDNTYEISGQIMMNGEKRSIKDVIREDDSFNLDPNSLSENDAKEVIYNAWMNQNRELGKKEVVSEDHGLMQINDATWKSSRVRTSLSDSLNSETDWGTVSWDEIKNDPATNLTFASDIVKGTPNGWSNWSVYKDALNGNPNSVWKKTIQQVKDEGLDSFKTSPKMTQYINMILDDRLFGKYTGKSNPFDLTDAELAFVIMMAESGGNPTAKGQNFKK